jgi:hypothetical protein
MSLHVNCHFICTCSKYVPSPSTCETLAKWVRTLIKTRKSHPAIRDLFDLDPVNSGRMQDYLPIFANALDQSRAETAYTIRRDWETDYNPLLNQKGYLLVCVFECKQSLKCWSMHGHIRRLNLSLSHVGISMLRQARGRSGIHTIDTSDTQTIRLASLRRVIYNESQSRSSFRVKF